MPHHTHGSDDAHDHEEPEAGHVHESVDDGVDARDDWARRRRKGIPTDKRLLVVACMDERIPVEDALGLSLGDAQISETPVGR